VRSPLQRIGHPTEAEFIQFAAGGETRFHIPAGLPVVVIQRDFKFGPVHFQAVAAPPPATA